LSSELTASLSSIARLHLKAARITTITKKFGNKDKKPQRKMERKYMNTPHKQIIKSRPET
jgi:hypothetical protein